MKTSIIKPGYLVIVKTQIKGGINYTRQDIESEHVDAEGAVVSRWETSKEIPDPQGFERAVLARTAARGAIGKVCAYSPAFGFMFPGVDSAPLEAAIAEARRIATEHNASGTASILNVSVICGRIAQNDVEAARAVSAEMRDLLDNMRAGIAAADPARIREAANKAKQLGGMLSEDASGAVAAAIAEARIAARDIMKRVVKAGETAADVVAEIATAKLDSARFSFLDLDAPVQVDAFSPEARGIDLSADDPAQAPIVPDPAPSAPSAPPVLEMGGLDDSAPTWADLVAPAAAPRALEF